MSFLHLDSKTLSDAWDVLLLFIIPVGGGIPAGVVLAKNRGLEWPLTAFLYFISDIMLACVFEPLMLFFLHWSKKNDRFALIRQALAQSTRHLTDRYGFNPSPWALIMITFGTDPMTGRSVAKAAGHGFLWGWTLTIIGDMIFFSVVMASTLRLNDVLGNGTWAAVIITLAILGIPPLLKKWRGNPA